ncbi:MAG: lytic transglycosylase domain-containing protein [Candidatus Eremiobacteraeota bacterium]|nr:lytic transglycosylase domain-containing protein [Candidatus Eremiobacteraeota bacterium]
MNIATSLVHRLAVAGVNFAPEIAGAARRHGVDPALLAAVAAQETGGPGTNGGANIVGDGGHGHGVFQIDDRWHSFACTPGAMNPERNADYAAGMLSGLLHRYGGNVREALSAYNAGSPNATGTTTRWGDGKVLGYADSVLRHYGSIAQPDDVETARANIACTAQTVNEPLALMSAMAPPPHVSWRSTEGLDATGHSHEEQLDPLLEGDDN